MHSIAMESTTRPPRKAPLCVRTRRALMRFVLVTTASRAGWTRATDNAVAQPECAAALFVADIARDMLPLEPMRLLCKL